MITAPGLLNRIVSELIARGMNPMDDHVTAWAYKFAQALSSSLATNWHAALLVPGNGPVPIPPPTQPHAHIVAPGAIHSGLLRASADALLLPPAGQFVVGYAWGYFVQAWAETMSAAISVIVTDVQDGNIGVHQHHWLGPTQTTLAIEMETRFRALYGGDFHPELPTCKFYDFVNGLAKAFSDGFNTDASTSVPLVTGNVHVHEPF